MIRIPQWVKLIIEKSSILLIELHIVKYYNIMENLSFMALNLLAVDLHVIILRFIIFGVSLWCWKIFIGNHCGLGLRLNVVNTVNRILVRQYSTDMDVKIDSNSCHLRLIQL